MQLLVLTKAQQNGEDLQIFDDFFNTGRPNHYHQKLNTTYNLPLDKFPFLSFMKADYAYTADFDWQAAPQNTINCRKGWKFNSECKYT